MINVFVKDTKNYSLMITGHPLLFYEIECGKTYFLLFSAFGNNNKSWSLKLVFSLLVSDPSILLMVYAQLASIVGATAAVKIR